MATSSTTPLPDASEHFTRGLELVIIGVVAIIVATAMFVYAAWRKHTQSQIIASAIAEAGLNVDEEEPSAPQQATQRPIDRIKALLSS